MSCPRMLTAASTPNLTAIQQLVYIVIVGWADGDHCRTTIQAIADHINRSTQRATIYRAVTALAKLDLIRIEKAAHGVFRYQLLDPEIVSPGYNGHQATVSPGNYHPSKGCITTILSPPKEVVGECITRIQETAENSQSEYPQDTKPRARVDSYPSSKEERESPLHKPESVATVAAQLDSVSPRETASQPKPIRSGPPRFGDDPRIRIDGPDEERPGEPSVNGWYLKGVFHKCLEVANIDPIKTPLTWTPVVSWLNDGIEPDDIYEVIARITAKGMVRPRSLAYFDIPVRERLAVRVAA